MKKVFFVFAVAAATLSFVSCGPKPAANADTTADTTTVVTDTVDSDSIPADTTSVDAQ